MNGPDPELVTDVELAYDAEEDPARIVQRVAPGAARGGNLEELADLLEAPERKELRRWRRENGHPHGPGGATTVRLSQVEPETVRWLWPDRIPLGKVTMLDGDPGLLKSALTLDLAARLSTGRSMPDGENPDLEEPVGTVLLTAEDGLADTVRPRLDAAAGDPSRVVVVEEVSDPEGGARLPNLFDLAAIEAAVKTVDARLLVIDPLMAYLPPDVNSHRDQDVRRALAPLAKLADELGVAVVAIRHLNKSGGGNPKYRGGGSIGIIGAARSGYIVGEDPNAPDTRRIFAPVKSNLSEPAPPLSYRAAQADNGAVRVEWEGEADHGADTLLDRRSPEERTKVEEAAHVLEEELSDGARPVKELYRVANDLGISERTMRRAARRKDVKKEKASFGGGTWRWSLPDTPLQERESGQKEASDPREPPTAQGRRLSGQGGGQKGHGPGAPWSSEDSRPFLDSEERDTGGECRKCGESIGPSATICGSCRREAS